MLFIWESSSIVIPRLDLKVLVLGVKVNDYVQMLILAVITFVNSKSSLYTSTVQSLVRQNLLQSSRALSLKPLYFFIWLFAAQITNIHHHQLLFSTNTITKKKGKKMIYYFSHCTNTQLHAHMHKRIKTPVRSTQTVSHQFLVFLKVFFRTSQQWL